MFTQLAGKYGGIFDFELTGDELEHSFTGRKPAWAVWYLLGNITRALSAYGWQRP